MSAAPAKRLGPALALQGDGLRAERPYPSLIPEGLYLAKCVEVFRGNSRAYGEKFYLTFRIFDGPHAGKQLRMFTTTSTHHTSNYFRAWCIANDGLPTRNARLSPRLFLHKLFRVRVVTQRPRHRVKGPDGKLRHGDELPDIFHYSKVEHIVALEVTNEPPRSLETTPQIVTVFPRNPTPHTRMSEGEGGNKRLEAGSKGVTAKFAARDGQQPASLSPAESEGDFALGLIPAEDSSA